MSELPPISYARAVIPQARAADTRFPRFPMSRGGAAIDFAAAVAAIVLTDFIFVIIGLSDRLQHWWPEGGILLWPVFNGTACMFFVAGVTLLRRQPPAAIGLGPAPLSTVLGGSALTIPACFVVGAISNLVFTAISRQGIVETVQQRAEFFNNFSHTPIGLIVPVSVFVGIYEEILFRGFLLGRLRAITRSDAAALILSSLLFGAAHVMQGPIGMVQTTMLGLVLGGVVLITRSIWPVIIAHGLLDAINLSIVSLLRDELQEAIKALTSTQAAS